VTQNLLDLESILRKSALRVFVYRIRLDSIREIESVYCIVLDLDSIREIESVDLLIVSWIYIGYQFQS
jgi:hypothetical protein